MCVSHIQMPPTKNHSTFMKMLRQPGCDSRHFTFVPNGQMASIPSFMLCKPKGMPMMVIFIVFAIQTDKAFVGQAFVHF